MWKPKLEYCVLTAITQDCCYRLWFFSRDLSPVVNVEHMSHEVTLLVNLILPAWPYFSGLERQALCVVLLGFVWLHNVLDF